MRLEVHITGVDDVAIEMKAIPGRVHKAVERSIGRSLLALTRLVKQSKLTGQVLHVRTGRLRRSIHSEMSSTPEEIIGIVGTDVAYARVHEFGFTGEVNVRQHLRTIKQAFGRSIEPTQILVGAHGRHVSLPERSFLRSALQEMEPEILAGIRRAVVTAL